MRDVAAAAGVHPSTVSLALRGHASIPAATGLRIRNIAISLGYTVNPLVASLMRTRRCRSAPSAGIVLAWVTRFPSRDYWRTSRRYRRLFKGARSAMHSRGFDLQEFWMLENNQTDRRFAEILRARGIQGLLFAPLPATVHHLALPWDWFSTVTLGHSLQQPNLHRVSTRYFQEMRECCVRLRSLGYRRIGFYLPASWHTRTGDEWLGAYLVESLRWPGCDRIAPQTPIQFRTDSLLKWIKEEKLDVVISVGFLAERICRVLRTEGYRLPDDLGVASLDCPGSDSRTSGIFQHVEAEGAAAADLLIDLVHRNQKGVPTEPTLLTIGGHWVAGNTLRSA